LRVLRRALFIYKEECRVEKSLGARLLCVAQSIPKCKSLIDCGCDHGHVSIYAARNGIAERITASDINRGPLDNAEREIAAAGQGGKISTVLTDGLDGLSPHDCVVIAGMGGETIADIISRAPWTKNECTLVLQPMTKTELLRDYLYGEGFEITDEKFVSESGHMYCIIIAKGGVPRAREPFESYISRAGTRSESADVYTDKIIARLRYEYERKCAANALSDEEKKKSEELLASLTEMRESL